MDIFSVSTASSLTAGSTVALGSFFGVLWQRGVPKVDASRRQAQYDDVCRPVHAGLFTKDPTATRNSILGVASVLLTAALVVSSILVFIGPTLFLSVPRDGLNQVSDTGMDLLKATS